MPTATIARIRREPFGLDVASVQLLHDGPEQRIIRFFVRKQDDDDKPINASALFVRHGDPIVIVTSGERKYAEVRLMLPDRLQDDRGGYFVASVVDGGHVTTIMAKQHMPDRGEERTLDDGSIIREVVIP